mmetsp:Transcript_97690/g.146430  ORF Transcript_97690/g.146430 Transcript_97690/m.146430 type:complete len:135 (+) Transcript_97690:2761-3165(+)
MSRRPQLKSNGDNERRAACRVDKDRWEQMQEHKLDQPLPCDAVLVNAADLVDAVRSRYVQQHFHHHDDSFLMLNSVLVLFQAVSVPGPIQISSLPARSRFAASTRASSTVSSTASSTGWGSSNKDDITYSNGVS